MIAQVVINRSSKKLNRLFDYKIPEKWEEYIKIGSKVWVPFGNSKNLEQAYVVEIKQKSDFKVKEIAKIEGMLTNEQMELAKWMAKKYYCNLSDAIKLFLPPGNTKKQKAKEKTIQVIYLNKENNIDIPLKSEKQNRILQYLQKQDGKTVKQIEEDTGCSRAVVNALVKKGCIYIKEEFVIRDPLKDKNIKRTEKLQLTKEQNQAYEKIEKTILEKEYKTFLLYGVTGAGKTEVYLQLIEGVIKQNRSAVVLVPEISLTPQMLNRFVARFGKEKIAVLHSKLSMGERYDEWNKINKGNANIIIGARSAIFAPVKDIGIIIIDEEHDMSYKSDMPPKYETKEVAKKIAKQHKCPLVLGSATPDLCSFYEAQNGKMDLITLTKRANNSALPNVTVIDLKQELAEGNRSMISRKLYTSMEENLKNKKQTILFLNRRGFSTFIMCRDCGYTVKCENCDISMTYHRQENCLKCHYCGKQKPVVSICPKCKSTKIRYFGTGTQKLENEIHKLFPTARTIRMDIDTVTQKNSHEEILEKFQKEEADILIGTQMVVKGHHFPKVTLVGVIAADSSLNMDDFRANERTFQILTQVAGRAGREKEKGEVIIQTYETQSFSIECAKKQDYLKFYKTEIELRKQLKYPPFCDIILISFQAEELQNVTKASNWFYKKLKENLYSDDFNIFKPTPAPIEKIQGKYRWRIICKGNITEDATIILNKILQQFYRLTKNGVRVSIDSNPNNML